MTSTSRMREWPDGVQQGGSEDSGFRVTIAQSADHLSVWLSGLLGDRGETGHCPQ